MSKVVDLHGQPVAPPPSAPAATLSGTLAQLDAGLRQLRVLAEHRPDLFAAVTVTLCDGRQCSAAELLCRARRHVDAIDCAVSSPLFAGRLPETGKQASPPLVSRLRAAIGRAMRGGA